MLCPGRALSGKTYLVTGSTDGIGLFTAQRLAAAGGDVIVHGRSRDRVAAAVAKVEAEARGKAKVAHARASTAERPQP